MRFCHKHHDQATPGLHDKKKTIRKRTTKKKSPGQRSLFDEER